MIDNVISGKMYWFSSNSIDVNARQFRSISYTPPIEVVVKISSTGNISIETKEGKIISSYISKDDLYRSKEEAIEEYNTQILNSIKALTLAYENTKEKLESLLI